MLAVQIFAPVLLAGCGGGGLGEPTSPLAPPIVLGCTPDPECCGCGLDLPPQRPWVPLVLDTTGCQYVGDADLMGGNPSDVWACGLTCGPLESDNGMTLGMDCR